MATTRSAQPIQDVIDQIISKNAGISRFWNSAHGWAPLSAAELLSKSRLDWQVSLSRTLMLWVPPAASSQAPDADARLILGWANLGSLVEGSLKWFLSVFYDDYQADISAIRKTGDLIDPDVMTLEPIRVFFQRSIWTAGDDWDSWVLRIQQRRNAIHSFRDRPIGTIDELEGDIRKYGDLLAHLDGRVPYPDELYRP